LPHHPPAGKVVISMRPVSVFAKGTGSEIAPGVTGFRRAYQQALNAQAVVLAAGPSGQPVTSFGQVAPLALMSGSIELLQASVIETLGALADDEHNARLRDTLRVSCRRTAATRPPRNVSCCTRTRSSTGCARPRQRAPPAH